MPLTDSMTFMCTAKLWAFISQHHGSERALLEGYLEISRAPGDEVKLLTEEAWRVIWPRLVIDLQRTKLQASAGVATLPHQQRASLIPQDLILEVLEALLVTKKRIYSKEAAEKETTMPLRIYLLQTILCTLRLLVLRNEPVDVSALADYERRLRSLWEHPQIHWIETHIIGHLIPSLVTRLSQGKDGQSIQAGEGDFLREHGISAGDEFTDLRIRPVNFVESAASKSISNNDASATFWRIFDALWAAESALIHCCTKTYARPVNDGVLCATPEQKFLIAKAIRDRILSTALDLSKAASHGSFPFADRRLRFCLTSTLLQLDAPSHFPGTRPVLPSMVSTARSFIDPTLAMQLDSAPPFISTSLHRAMVYMLDWEREALASRSDSLMPPSAPQHQVLKVAPQRECLMAVPQVGDSRVMPRGGDLKVMPYVASRGAVIPSIPKAVEHFALSSSGSHIYIWGSKILGILRLRVDLSALSAAVGQRSVLKTPHTPVAVASGHKLTVAVCKQPGAVDLLFYHEDKHHSWQHVEVYDEEITGIQLSIARHDKWVGLMVNHRAYMYHLVDNAYRQSLYEDRLSIFQSRAGQQTESDLKLSLEQEAQARDILKAIRDRRIGFTPSGKQAIIATSLSDDRVYIDAVRLDGEDLVKAVAPDVVELPPSMPSNRGLTGVFYNESSGVQLPVAGAGHEYNAHLRVGEGVAGVPVYVSFPKESVIVAQSPEESCYLLFDGRGKARFVRLGQVVDNVHRVKAADVKCRKLSAREAKVAFANDSTVVVLWIDRRRKLHLRIVDVVSEQKIKECVL